MHLCEFELSLIYKVSFRTARTVTQRDPVSKKNGRNEAHTYIDNRARAAFSFPLSCVYLCNQHPERSNPGCVPDSAMMIRDIGTGLAVVNKYLGMGSSLSWQLSYASCITKARSQRKIPNQIPSE